MKKQQLAPNATNDDDGADLLGFHSKPSAKRDRDEKPREREEKPRDDKNQRERGGKKKEKVVLNDDDFPSLWFWWQTFEMMIKPNPTPQHYLVF